MIVYGVMVTTKVSYYCFDFGVKVQCQIYLNYTMSHSFYTYVVASSIVFSFSRVQIIYFPNIYIFVFQSPAPKWTLLSYLYTAVFLSSCFLQYRHSKLFISHSSFNISSIGPTIGSMTSRRQIQDGGPNDFRSKMAAPMA